MIRITELTGKERDLKAFKIKIESVIYEGKSGLKMEEKIQVLEKICDEFYEVSKTH